MLRTSFIILICLGLAFAQDYSGKFTQQDDPTTILELNPSAQGYTGTLLDSGQTSYRIEAFVEDGLLFGTIFLTEANLAQDLFFGAEFVGQELLLTTALMTANGEIDQSSFQEFSFIAAQPAVPQTNNPLSNTAQNPLANPLGQVESQTKSPNPLAQTSPSTQTSNPLGSSSAGLTNATAIQADQVYQAGTALSSAATGLSFIIPTGFQGGYDSQQASLTFVDQSQTQVLAMQAVSSIDASQLGQATLQAVADTLDENAAIQELAAPQQQAGRFLATYNVNGSIVHVIAQQGPAGNAAVVLGFGVQSVIETANQFAASLSLTTPQTQTQVPSIGGIDFFSNKSDSYYSPGGVGDGSFVSGTERYYTFCGNGAYGFQYSSKSFVSVEGAGSMASEDSDSHNGSYTLAQSLMGDLVISLTAQDGRLFLVDFEQVAEGIVIDGFLYQASQSQQCN